MTYTDTLSVILNTLSEYGVRVLVILGAVILIGVAYLIFKFGKRLIFDESLMIGGFYMRKLPYRGYHRFRSREWNMKHVK